MSQGPLGLFDTPPTRRQVRLSLSLIIIAALVSLLILPVRDVRLPPVNAFIPTVDAIMFVGDLITATLLYAQAAIYRSRALTVLATGYVLTAFLLIPHALTFPGAFAANGLLGAGINTTAWLAIFQRAVFPIAVILYVRLKHADSAAQRSAEGTPKGAALWVCSAVAVAAALTLLATVGHDLLPDVFSNQVDLIYSRAVAYQSPTIVLVFIAIAMLVRTRSSVLDMWLLVALSGWMIQGLLNMTLHGRFTLGFYSYFAVLLTSHLVLMIALIAESNWLYVRLALSTSAQSRERERRLMSMNAMAAAVFREVGQPLSAMINSASATKEWLSRERPNHERASESLHDTIAAGERTFDVLKNVRAKFSGSSEAATEFSLNTLLREIALEMNSELAAKNAVLQLDLAETLPSVRSDRVQMRRVLSYLVAILLDSESDTRRRPPRVTVRTRPSEGRHVFLEVSAANVSDASRDMEQIFGPVGMSKDCDFAQALSLCHTIIEDQGGYLWVAYDGSRPTRFRVSLPRAKSSDYHTELMG
jgi:signal transduction histidine kinase